METDNGERFELTYYVAESSLMHFVWKHAAGMCSTLMCLVQDKVKANGMLNDSIFTVSQLLIANGQAHNTLIDGIL